MSRITTHVLDVSRGLPARGIPVRLDALRGDAWHHLATSTTNADGRVKDFGAEVSPGIYRLTFETVAYFTPPRKSVYPEIQITFTVADDPHYHLPVLLSENSYTTYRGS